MFTGHSLALGCLHRCVGGVGSSNHLSTSISILLALARDVTAPLVQVWALHALSMIADSGGPMFRNYVDPALGLLLDLLLTSPSIEVQHCIGKCLQALITTIGPELQMSDSATALARWSLLCGCGLVQQHSDPLVQAEAVTCLQQMHMFAPRHVNLSSLVPMLVQKLSSTHLLLRRAAVSCLRQLAQREAWEVCHHVETIAASDDIKLMDSEGDPIVLPESGLPGLLFSLLDCENDPILVSHAQHTLLFTLHALAPTHLCMWLKLCREVLTNAQDSANDGNAGESGDPTVDDEDLVQFHASIDPDPNPAVPPRWTSRVFAAQCVAKIILECSNQPEHFDLQLAREKQVKEGGKGEFLVIHLSELIRMGFMAATSESDQLRLEGLDIFQLVIDKFGNSPEPEFPGHVILEQYQAQVGAALRPAFAADTASHVTARACQVCSTWIGSGVARDLNDLRRVHQLLVSSLTKLNENSNKGLYNESAATLEKLAILKAWAEVYIVSQKTSQTKASGDDCSRSTSSCDESLGSLVSPELRGLSHNWLAALKDHAMLGLPPEFSSQLPHAGGAFYSTETMDNVRGYYRRAWAPILYALALWLSNSDSTDEINANKETENKADDNSVVMSEKNFFLLMGNIVHCLCGENNATAGTSSSTAIDSSESGKEEQEERERVELCLKALHTLLQHPLPIKLLSQNVQLAIETVSLMQRQTVSSDVISIHQLSISIVDLIISGAVSVLNGIKRDRHLADGLPANHQCAGCDADLEGEGGETGEINPTNSLVFSALQVCLCCLVRYEPSLAPAVVSSAPSLLGAPRKSSPLHLRHQLLANTVSLCSKLPELCSPAGGVAILPTVLFLTTGVIREVGHRVTLANLQASFPPSPEPTVDTESLSSSSLSCHTTGKVSHEAGRSCDVLPLSASFKVLGGLCSHGFSRDSRSSDQWCSLLQSALTTVLHSAKAAEEDRELCDSILVEGITEFLVHAPTRVTAPNNLRYPAINLLKTAVHHANIDIRLSCITQICRVFREADPDVANVFMREIGPRLLYQLHQTSTFNTKKEIELFEVLTDAMLLIFGHTKVEFRCQMLGVVLTLLVSCLSDDNDVSPLHSTALIRLQKLAPQYPQEFRTIMSQRADLKSKLESAIKASQAAANSSRLGSANANRAGGSAAAELRKPTIQLKMDFSNFK